MGSAPAVTLSRLPTTSSFPREEEAAVCPASLVQAGRLLCPKHATSRSSLSGATLLAFARF